jgi:phospholipid transport system substrate-binding protein
MPSRERDGDAEGVSYSTPIDTSQGAQGADRVVKTMISRRTLMALAGLTALPRLDARADPAPDAAVGIVRSFYAVLLATMKEGKGLGFGGRRDKLSPAIRQTFDFSLMTRLTVGPPWSTLTPEQQKQLLDAFSAFSVATYANRFDDYSGERFDVDDTPTSLPNGDLIVKSQLVPETGDDVELDYLMRYTGQAWHVIDVYLSGTVSELAVRRSEFSSVLRRDGPSALVNLLHQKVAELSS